MDRPESGLGAVGLLALAVVGVVVALFLLRTVVGLAIGGGHDPSTASPSASATPTASAESAPGPAVTSISPVAQGTTAPNVPAVVPVSLAPYALDRFVPTYPAVGELDDGSVLQLDLSGFAGGATGVIRQCVYTGGELGECGRPLPVNFNEDGRARVQYQLAQAVAPALTSCTGYVRPCYVSIEDAEGNHALLLTVFGPLPAPGRIDVSQRTGLHLGDELEVRVTGFRYDVGRTVAALALCLALVVLAWWLWRRTDWDGPSEAATPEMDASRLD